MRSIADRYAALFETRATRARKRSASTFFEGRGEWQIRRAHSAPSSRQRACRQPNPGAAQLKSLRLPTRGRDNWDSASLRTVVPAPGRKPHCRREKGGRLASGKRRIVDDASLPRYRMRRENPSGCLFGGGQDGGILRGLLEGDIGGNRNSASASVFACVDPWHARRHVRLLARRLVVVPVLEGLGTIVGIQVRVLG